MYENCYNGDNLENIEVLLVGKGKLWDIYI